jgi:NhaP-type Na+/H+ or K+/H+ antiporter
VSGGTLPIDIAIAVLAAAIVLVISPGFAISGVIAVVVLLICGGLQLRSRKARRRAAR